MSHYLVYTKLQLEWGPTASMQLIYRWSESFFVSLFLSLFSSFFLSLLLSYMICLLCLRTAVYADETIYACEDLNLDCEANMVTVIATGTNKY